MSVCLELFGHKDFASIVWNDVWRAHVDIYPAKFERLPNRLSAYFSQPYCSLVVGRLIYNMLTGMTVNVEYVNIYSVIKLNIFTNGKL